jgi:succinoglycan biosynthesis transport protein ExoP
MALDERTVLSDDSPNNQALALTQPSTTSPPTGLWAKPSQDIPMSITPGVDLKTYLYAFRRHWVLALGMGLLVSAIVGPLVWFGIGAQFTANAFLRVSYEEKSLVFSSGQRPYEAEFEIFKNTQMQLIQNRFVISAAFRKKPELNRLSIIKKQDDPISWLMNNITVSFPGKAEVMEIKLRAYDPMEARDIVTAVVDAYMSEVVDYERDQRRQRISELDRFYSEKDAEVRYKRHELKQLAEQLGTAETETLSLKQKLTLEELSSYRQELVRSQFEVGRLRSELAARYAELQTVEKLDISDIECEMFAQNDPELKDLKQEIILRKKDAENKNPAELERIQKDYSERIAQIREEIRRKRIGEVEKEIARLKAAIEIANKQQQANEEEVKRLQRLAEQFGSSSIDVEMLRADIEIREKVLRDIAIEREKLRVELRAASRITPLQSKAEAKKRPPLFFIP